MHTEQGNLGWKKNRLYLWFWLRYVVSFCLILCKKIVYKLFSRIIFPYFPPVQDDCWLEKDCKHCWLFSTKLSHLFTLNFVRNSSSSIFSHLFSNTFSDFLQQAVYCSWKKDYRIFLEIFFSFLLYLCCSSGDLRDDRERSSFHNKG